MATLFAVAGLASGCLRFSPFELELSEEQRDHIQKNLALLAQHERPPASPEAPLRFALLADSHDGYENLGLIVDEINARPELEFALFAGDISDFGATQEYVWAWKQFSRLSAPFLATPGNHDGLSQGKQLFARMFGATDYAFEYAGLQFVSLNTNTIEWGLDSPDFEFLQRTLRASPLKSVIFSHQGPSVSLHIDAQTSAQFLQLIEQEPVSLYLFGHIHENFGAAQVGQTQYVKTASALEGRWMIIESDGERFTPTACLLASCDQPIVTDVPTTPAGQTAEQP